MSIYDDPDVQVSGDFVKFEEVGDGVVGTITSVGKHEFPDGKRTLKYRIDTEDGEKVLTAGQVQLAQKLIELRPNVGDKVSIKFTGVEKRAGGKTMKLFDVKVKPGEPEEEPF